MVTDKAVIVRGKAAAALEQNHPGKGIAMYVERMRSTGDATEKFIALVVREAEALTSERLAKAGAE